MLFSCFNGGWIYGGSSTALFCFRFFTNFHFDFSKDLLEVLRFFPLLNHDGKFFEKKSSGWPSRDLENAVGNPPHKSNYYTQISTCISLCPIFMKLGTFVHFIGNSDLEKIWVDTDIFVGVMTSSKKKCGGGPPHKSNY